MSSDEKEPESRDPEGRFKKGHSGNPGGMSRAALEARKAFAEDLANAQRVVRGMLKDKNPWARLAASQVVFDRALGKTVTAAELPSDSKLPSPSEASPPALLARAYALFERSIASAEQQVADGLPLSEAQRAALREDAHTLATLAKEERELSKHAPGADLSDEKLLDAVLEKVPAEKLLAALEKKK